MKINFPPTTAPEFVEKYLEFISALQPSDKKLHETERELLAAAMLLPPKYLAFPFSRPSKKKILDLMPRSITMSNFNNKVYSLLEKGYIKRDEDKVLLLAPFLVKAITEFRKNKTFSFNLTFNEAQGYTAADSADSENT